MGNAVRTLAFFCCDRRAVLRPRTGTLRTGVLALPFLFAGMFLGGKLYARMSQRAFMKLSYVLVFVSGLSLLAK